MVKKKSSNKQQWLGVLAGSNLEVWKRKRQAHLDHCVWLIANIFLIKNVENGAE
jgi:hypothetical protein